MTDTVVVDVTQDRILISPGTVGLVVVPGPGSPTVTSSVPGTVVTEAPDDEVIEVGGAQGQPGPPGADGADGSGIVDTLAYRQSILASTWTIPHSLGRRPQVEVTDDDGNDLWPHVDVLSISPWTVSVVHATPLTGYAYLT